ncbi:MAG: LytR C-terminal domain-containing protein [Candidatus Levyibacteriota bacterium]
MKKKSAQHQSSKSLKTFYIYSFIVFLLILISLIVRGVILFEQNIFDPVHHFILTVQQKGTVKEIISFNPQIPAVSVLRVDDKNIPYKTLAKEYGVPSDGYIQLDDSMPLTTDPTALMWTSIMHAATLDSNLTIFDSVRLFLMSKNVATNNEISTDVSLKNHNIMNTNEITQALTDLDIASESISIQIINATNITGMGQRLGRILTNTGANVVDVSSAKNSQKETTIAYFGDSSFTLTHLQKLLHVTPTKLTKQPIANIIITIGNDKRNTSAF